MKSILGFVAVCFTAAVLGCQTSTTVSPGALGNECGAKEGAACTKAKSECCGAARCTGAQADLGAVSDKSECQLKKQTECTKSQDANLGAVSEKAECHHQKSECQKKACPATGATGSSCTKEAEANLGAMSEEKAGCGAKRSCGAKKAGCGSN